MNWTEAHLLGDLEAMEKSEMTDLIARLGDPNRDWPEFGHDRREAVDRIEELVKERDDYKDLYYAGFKDAASLNIHYAEVGYKAKTAEAKLAKAVKTLQILKPLLGDSWVDRRVLAVLAELEKE